MIKVTLTQSPLTKTIEIKGHANYGDAPAKHGNMFEKVCACVTLIALTIEEECNKQEIMCEIDRGYIKASIRNAKFNETFNTCITQLYMLDALTNHYYIDIVVKGKN